MDFENIEKSFDVASLTRQGVSVWPILKSYLIGIQDETPIIKEPSSSVLKILLYNLFSDIVTSKNLKKSKHWVFTNSERRYHINHTSFDRITSGLLGYIKDYVLFENPVPKGRTKKESILTGEYYMGMSWVFLAQFLAQKILKKPKIENIEALESYLGKDLTKIKNVFHRICAGERVYDYLIKKYKPKAIFVVCYYSNFEVIKAAKKNKVPIIELQHGMVSTGHRAYYFSKDYGKALMPDYFLSYGQYSAEVVVKGHIVPKTNVLNYGYSFLDEVANRLKLSTELEQIKKGFKKVICITGQLPVTDEPLLTMINEAAILFPDICFIYKPRFNDSTTITSNHPNFIQNFEMNTYELLKYCDYHLTVYSTCAMECLALGTPTISIDIKGFYSKFLKPLLHDNPFNFVASDSKGLIKLLKSLEKTEFDQHTVTESISPIFSKMVSSKAFSDFFDKVVV